MGILTGATMRLLILHSVPTWKQKEKKPRVRGRIHLIANIRGMEVTHTIPNKKETKICIIISTRTRNIPEMERITDISTMPLVQKKGFIRGSKVLQMIPATMTMGDCLSSMEKMINSDVREREIQLICGYSNVESDLHRGVLR